MLTKEVSSLYDLLQNHCCQSLLSSLPDGNGSNCVVKSTHYNDGLIANSSNIGFILWYMEMPLFVAAIATILQTDLDVGLEVDFD